jgi:hypothetical protein
MSLTAITKPPIWSPAYNPIIWEVSSNETAQFKFKYVFDVYISPSVTPLRYKVPANPNGIGIINVQSLCEAELSITDNLPFLSSNPFYLGTGMATRVYILAGEEYASSPTGEAILYNGSGVVGQPAFGLYANSDFNPAPSTTDPVVAYAAGQGAQEYYSYQESGGEDIEQFVMDSPTSKFLRNEPNNPSEIRSDEKISLSFLNWDFLAATGPQVSPYAMKTTLSLGGTAVQTDVYLNTVANGGVWSGPTGWVNNVDNFGPTSGAYFLNNFVLDLNTINTNFDEICFQLFPYQTYGATGLGATGISEQVCYNINNDNCWGFEPIRITWLNNKGGRDWYTFIKRNTFTQNAERDSFFKLPGYWSGSGFSLLDINPSTYGTTVFNVNLQQAWTASTDWLSEQDSAWLRDLFKSPSVHVYLPGNPQPTLVQITDSSYSEQTFAREKLFQYFVSFVEAQPDTVQSY